MSFASACIYLMKEYENSSITIHKLKEDIERILFESKEC